MKLAIVIPALTLLGGCWQPGGPDARRAGRRAQPIVNGAPDPGHASAVILVGAGKYACTATLVGERTLVTAAHCVKNRNPPHEMIEPLEAFRDDLDGPALSIAGAVPYPDYAGKGDVKRDIAVVRLAAPLTGVSPTPLAADAPVVGETVTLVGYGYPSAAAPEFGTRRQATNTIGDMTALTFSVYGDTAADGHTCTGDSGGPTYAERGGEEVLLGVTSASASGCSGQSAAVRVDAYRDWLLGVAADATIRALPAAGAPAEDAAPRRGDAAVADADARSAPADGDADGAAGAGADDAGGCGLAPAQGPGAPPLLPALLGLVCAALLRRRRRRVRD